jgi:hypothetical protein
VSGAIVAHVEINLCRPAICSSKYPFVIFVEVANMTAVYDFVVINQSRINVFADLMVVPTGFKKLFYSGKFCAI